MLHLGFTPPRQRFCTARAVLEHWAFFTSLVLPEQLVLISRSKSQENQIPINFY